MSGKDWDGVMLYLTCVSAGLFETLDDYFSYLTLVCGCLDMLSWKLYLVFAQVSKAFFGNCLLRRPVEQQPWG